MKRLMTFATASAMFAISMPAFAQTAMTKCEPGEGQVLEYDFGKNFLTGELTLESLHSLRLASSNCVPGQPGKTTFRGVNAEFENMTQAQKALGAVQVLMSLGITKPAVIEQLIARVQTGIKQVEEQRPGVKYRTTVYVAETAEGEKK
jgi:hypothetical protein